MDSSGSMLVPPPGGRVRRVLAVIDWLEVGGAQHHLLWLASGLARAGYRFLVATSGNEALTAVYRRAGVPVLTLTQRSIKHRLSPAFLARLLRLVRRGQFDLIHGHLHSASVCAAMAARATGTPLVLTHHSMNTWRPAWQRVLGRWADRQADAVIAVATNIAAALQRSAVRARVIPNGVVVPERVWSPEEVAAGRQRFGLPHGAYVLSFVGRFTPDKNPLLFMEAAALVAARCAQAHFFLVGDGPLRPAVERRSRALGLERRMVFVGFQPNAAELHPVADVLVLSSDSEGAPLVVLEAMARARPVVATAVGDVPLQIADGETGFVVTPRDPHALAEALLTLTDPALRQRFGAAARARVQCRFAVERWLARTAAVYQEVLVRRGVAPPPTWPSAAEVLPYSAAPPVAAVDGQERAVVAQERLYHPVDPEARPYSGASPLSQPGA